MEIPEPYLSLVKQNYAIIQNSKIVDDTLSRYITGCFNDVWRALGLYKCWVCVACMALNRFSYGWGDKPNSCPKCGKSTYEVATFQARASYVGSAFEYACVYLLKHSFDIDAKPTSEATRLYDFEIKPNLVVEAKGSPHYILNPDGSKSSLGRAGMTRSDTKKKAFANATEWRRRFPDGHFFIITNALPNELYAYRNDKIRAIYDITKARQLNDFVAELKSLGL